MKKVILYDPNRTLNIAKQALKQKEEAEECLLLIFHKKEQMLFYFEEVCWDIDILIYYIKSNFDEDAKFLQFCRKKARWMKVFLLADGGMSGELFSNFFPDGLLVLPVKKEQFLRVLEYLENLADKEYRRCITISVKGKLYRIPYKELIFVESEGHYIILKTKDEQIRIYGKLDDVIKKLPIYFRRCHKSYVVNLHYVKQLEMYQIRLYQNGECIPVSQKHYKEMKAYMEAFGEWRTWKQEKNDNITNEKTEQNNFDGTMKVKMLF